MTVFTQDDQEQYQCLLSTWTDDHIDKTISRTFFTLMRGLLPGSDPNCQLLLFHELANQKLKLAVKGGTEAGVCESVSARPEIFYLVQSGLCLFSVQSEIIHTNSVHSSMGKESDSFLNNNPP